MATLTATPSQVGTGDIVTITGEGFEPSTVVTLTITELNITSEIVTDAGGLFGTDDVADHATVTLTSSGVNVTDGDTVTLGAVTYRFKNTMAQANDVKIGADASTTLANLKATVNLTGTAGTEFFAGTVIHPTITAGKKTATTILFYAKTGGTGGNSLASTKVAATLTFSAATLTGGTAATGVSAVILSFDQAGTLDVSATDGTNTATCTIQVFAG